MRIHTHASKVLAGALALVFLGQGAVAGWVYTPGKGLSYEYAEGKKITLGADVRARLTHADIHALLPETGNDPAMEWLRVRTRLKLGMDLWDGAYLSTRFVNRVHNVSSHPLDPNDFGTATWQYPDEIIADQIALTQSNLAGIEGLSITLGRQDFILGNGMVMLEGTPYDQGRTIYFDGASLRYKNECDALVLFAFYNDAQDPIVVEGDEDRDLRRGDIFTTGIDWTHTFNASLSTELYYIYAKVDDDNLSTSQRQFEKNSNAKIHTVGARVFGKPAENLAYSVEVARQFSHYDENPTMASTESSPKICGEADGEGWMVDARLTAMAPESCLKPSLMFEYTYFSGDDPDTADYEGWDGLFAEYPIWRDELIPILNNGNWTNLHQYRAELKLKLHERVAFTGAGAYLLADESGTAFGNGVGGGDGRHFGDLYSAFLDYTVNDYIKISLEASFFRAGDYWDTNADSKWLRFQTVFSF
jgi:hypothetical protein